MSWLPRPIPAEFHAQGCQCGRHDRPAVRMVMVQENSSGQIATIRTTLGDDTLRLAGYTIIA